MSRVTGAAIARKLASATALAVGLACLSLLGDSLHGQSAQTPAGKSIQSLSGTGDALAIKGQSRSGFARFTGVVGQSPGIPLTGPSSDPAPDRARRFVQSYGSRFGIADASELRLTRSEGADMAAPLR